MRNKAAYSSAGKSGIDKANKFAATVRAHGWECQVLNDGNGQVTAFARRGDQETIKIWWIGEKGAITIDFPPMYTLAGEKIKLLNVSACVKIATQPIDLSRLNKAAKKQRRRSVNVPALQAAADDDLSSPGSETLAGLRKAASDALGLCHIDDRRLRARLIDQPIEWVNSISGKTEFGVVNHIVEIKRNGNDYVTFTDKEGFHSVYLQQIVNVG